MKELMWNSSFMEQTLTDKHWMDEGDQPLKTLNMFSRKSFPMQGGSGADQSRTSKRTVIRSAPSRHFLGESQRLQARA